MPERVVASVNLAAIERNCRRLRDQLAPQTVLCAVVKADAYGHGAIECARAAQVAGASWLAVATAAEAAQLRAAGITGRVLVMGALTRAELDQALAADADVVAWTREFVARAAAAGGGRVHVKLDTGMGRLGTRDPEFASALVTAVADAPELELAGAMTHFATADERGDSFFGEQLAAFQRWLVEVRDRYPGLPAHAANSAATLREPAAHFDMVRCGVAVYGLDPFGEDARASGLEPALELRSWLAALKPCAAGESAGYGRRFVAPAQTILGVVPIGYGDGWRRALTNNADVLIDGRRRPLVGTVSMDNIAVDLGARNALAVGATVTLIGADGAERISAEELAARLGTINYEVTCALLPRVVRRHHRDGEEVALKDAVREEAAHG
jgi:alanine racemase